MPEQEREREKVPLRWCRLHPKTRNERKRRVVIDITYSKRKWFFSFLNKNLNKEWHEAVKSMRDVRRRRKKLAAPSSDVSPVHVGYITNMIVFLFQMLLLSFRICNRHFQTSVSSRRCDDWRLQHNSATNVLFLFLLFQLSFALFLTNPMSIGF